MMQYEFKYNYTIYISRKTILWIVTDTYGDVLDIILRAPLWTDLYRGRIVGLLWYPHRGWCGWSFNHDGWVKWGCHDIATWLTRPTPVPGLMMMVFLLHKYIYVCLFYTHIFILLYEYMFFSKKTLVDSCLVLARRA